MTACECHLSPPEYAPSGLDEFAHDPLCPMATHAEAITCLCALIARIQAAERERLVLTYGGSAASAAIRDDLRRKIVPLREKSIVERRFWLEPDGEDTAMSTFHNGGTAMCDAILALLGGEPE